MGYSGTELITKDGTIPAKVILRRLVDVSGLFWRKEEERSRAFCFMSDALFITHTHIVGQHPHTLCWGTHQDTLTDVTDKLRTPAGG